MSLRDQLTADLKTAMKGGDKLKRDIVRNIRTVIKETEQSNKETLTKKAMKKHGVTRPSNQNDAEAMADYDKAIAAAMAAEKVEDNAALEDEAILGVIMKLVKMRQDSIADAEKAKRPDIAEAEGAELEVLMTYLPEQMSREEIEAEAKAAIEAAGITSMKEMGKIMGPLMGKLKGKADGKLISTVVRELLQG